MCCPAQLHHKSRVSQFLQIYGSITNTIACIVRVFNEVNVLFLVASLIGTHHIEHIWHSRTPEQLNMRSSRQLYHDLKNTSSSDILAVDKFVFSFTNGLVFEEVILWNPKLITSLKSYIQLYKSRMLQILDLLLPLLTEGWFVQGNVFGFGAFDPESFKLVTYMNMEDMNPASINNLDSKRSVGSINYGLSIYGRSEGKVL